MKAVIKTTADGSSTLYLPEFNEHYHSVNGAVQESVHVFINSGFKKVSTDPVYILEVGFGTGLNAMLTLLATSGSQKVYYHGIEPFPPDTELLAKLNYNEFLNLNIGQSSIFRSMHEIPWDVEVIIKNNFVLQKFKSTFRDVVWDRTYDLIYFDAFAPAVQPEMWTDDVFMTLYRQTNPGGILVTYCAKGDVRRSLQKAGYRVERLPGPPGKREILRAIKAG